jgi:uncharacterized small protein (DUF1192 family)
LQAHAPSSDQDTGYRRRNLRKRVLTVKPGTLQSRIAALKAEIDKIHAANYAYWKLPPHEQSRQARREYEQRRERLEEIRQELLGS